MNQSRISPADASVARSVPASMLEALSAQGPHPEHAEKLTLFGQFVGAWEVDSVSYLSDGTRETSRGEWHFGWILQGRGVQDVWISPSRSERQESGLEFHEYGTAVRVYEPSLDAWRVVWMGPIRSRQILFVARQQGDEIVLEGVESDAALQWIFSEIEPQSFRWRAQTSTDGGLVWHTVQEMFLRRLN